MQPLLIGGRLDGLRAALTTTHAAQWRRLYEQCDWYRGQSPPTEHPTASITYFGPAAMNLALAYRLTGQPGYLLEARRWIRIAVSYPHWGKAKLPDHDLDAGWLLHGLSLAYSWLRDELPADEAEALRAKLTLQGERLYSFAVETEGSWWSSSYWQNHNWICYAGLAAAGYVLDKPEWSGRARDNLGTVLDLMPDDGSDSEGVVYWRYGVPWLAIHLDLLQDAEGIDWWRRGGFLQRTFGWRLHQCAPGFEENIDHGDCHDRRSGHSVALYHKFAAVYRDGRARWLADRVAERYFWREAYASGVKPGVMPEAGYELLWYDPSVSAEDPTRTVATTAHFPDLGQVTARTGWHDAPPSSVSRPHPAAGTRPGTALSASVVTGVGKPSMPGTTIPTREPSSSVRTARSSPWMTAIATGNGPPTTTWCWLTGRAGRGRTATTSTRTCRTSARPGCGTCSPPTASRMRRPSRRPCSIRRWAYGRWTGRWSSHRPVGWSSSTNSPPSSARVDLPVALGLAGRARWR